MTGVVSKAKEKQGKAKQRNNCFGAYPKELARWKKAAARADRSLSWWIRSRIDTAERMGLAEDGKTPNPPVVDAAALVPVSFGAYPADIERWDKIAKKSGTARGWYIRKLLLALDAMEDESARADQSEAQTEAKAS